MKAHAGEASRPVQLERASDSETNMGWGRESRQESKGISERAQSKRIGEDGRRNGRTYPR